MEAAGQGSSSAIFNVGGDVSWWTGVGAGLEEDDGMV